jgi:hypothetical protein
VVWQHASGLSTIARGNGAGVKGKPRHEGPSRLDMVKVWLLDPRSRLAVRRRLAEFRLTRRSLLAAGMAVWLLYAGLVWQFGGRRLENCSSLACRALLGGLPIGPARARPPAEAAGAAAPAPTTTQAGPAPATAPTAGQATTTTTTSGQPLALLPGTTGAPPATAGEPTSTTAAGSTDPGSPTSSTGVAATTTSTTTPRQGHCKPKKHHDCKPKRPHPALQWWWPWRLAELAGGR